MTSTTTPATTTLGDRTQALLDRRQQAVPRGAFSVAPLFVERAEGWRLWDVEGREYLDFCGGIGVVNVGHNHPKVVAAIRAQTERLVHTCWHVAMYEPYLELAERLNAAVPMPGPNKTAFFNSGAEASENAVKIARAYTKRTAVVTFERGFHGRTLLALTMTGRVEPYARGFGPFAPEVYHLPFGPFFAPPEAPDAEVEAACRTALAHLFAYNVDAGRIACVIVEPVLGEGGFLPAHPAALRLLREECRRHEILFAADEVQSGFGRCGAMFAIERYGIEPDMVIVAKSLAAGLPLSGVTASAAVMDAPQVGGLGGTYGGNPVSCAAALAVFEVMEQEQLSARAEVIGKRVMESFVELAARHSFLARPRGLGAMRGIEVVNPQTGDPDPTRAVALITAARERGLLLMTASGFVIRTLMPLTIPDAELERALEILAAAAATIERGNA